MPRIVQHSIVCLLLPATKHRKMSDPQRQKLLRQHPQNRPRTRSARRNWRSARRRQPPWQPTITKTTASTRTRWTPAAEVVAALARRVTANAARSVAAAINSSLHARLLRLPDNRTTARRRTVVWPHLQLRQPTRRQRTDGTAITAAPAAPPHSSSATTIHTSAT